MQSLLKELDVTQSQPPMLWCDNIDVTYLLSNPVFHARTKHIEVDFHFVREPHVSQKQPQILFISLKDHVAVFLLSLFPYRCMNIVSAISIFP
jgi:hypothetical protein